MKKRRREGSYGLSEAWRKFINDEPDYNKMEILLDDDQEELIWETWGPSFLARWIEERPGSLPSLWWKYQAQEPRRRLRGIGRTLWKAGEDWLPFCVCGIPACRECWIFIDLSDPPQFEAQAGYLKRHGLLTPSEEEALKERPEAWEPETINYPTQEIYQKCLRK